MMRLNQFFPLMEASPTDREIRRKVALTHLYSGDADEALSILDSLKPTWATDESWELARANIFRDQGRRSMRRWMSSNAFTAKTIDACFLEWIGPLICLTWAKSRGIDLLDKVSLAVPPLGGVRGIGLSLNDLEKLQSVRDSAKVANAFFLWPRQKSQSGSLRYSDADGFLDKAL
jgi:hypothetical protein